MSHYPEQDSHIRNKVKAVLDFSNYANAKKKTKPLIMFLVENKMGYISLKLNHYIILSGKV